MGSNKGNEPAQPRNKFVRAIVQIMTAILAKVVWLGVVWVLEGLLHHSDLF